MENTRLFLGWPMFLLTKPIKRLLILKLYYYWNQMYIQFIFDHSINIALAAIILFIISLLLKKKFVDDLVIEVLSVREDLQIPTSPKQ